LSVLKAGKYFKFDEGEETMVDRTEVLSQGESVKVLKSFFKV
jgi:hypothetical protein